MSWTKELAYGFERQVILDSIRNLKVKLAPSKIKKAGIGLFAMVDITRDELIYDFKLKDHYFNYDEIADLPKNIRDYIWSMTGGDLRGFDLDVPAEMIYTAYYINHSFTPNVFWDRHTVS